MARCRLRISEAGPAPPHICSAGGLGKPDCSHVTEVVGGREARLKRVVVVVADGRDCVTRDEEFGFQDTTDGAVLPGLLAV